MRPARWLVAVMTGACATLAGCAAEANVRTGGTAASLVCDVAPPGMAETIAGGLARRTITLADSQVVRVQAIDQSSRGYPVYIAAARFDSPDGETVGLLALGNAPDFQPIFPMDGPALRATEFGRAVRPRNVVAAYVTTIAQSTSAAVARTCFAP